MIRASEINEATIPNPATKNLWDNVEMHKLAVDNVLPLHGRMVKVDELKLEAGVR